MTFLEKLDFLMEKNGYNRKRLSELSKISYTTISNWYQRGYDNISLPMFCRICELFDVTMESMAYDDMEITYKKDVAPVDFSPDERSLVHNFRFLDEEGRKRVLYTIDMEKNLEREKKKDSTTA